MNRRSFPRAVVSHTKRATAALVILTTVLLAATAMLAFVSSSVAGSADAGTRGAAAGGSRRRAYRADRVIVKFSRRTGVRLARARLANRGMTIMATVPNARVGLVKVPRGQSVTQAAKTLAQEPSVAEVSPDYVFRALDVPSDPSYARQWNLPHLSMASAWAMVKGSGKITIAVLDSGVDSNHEDLAANLTPGRNFVDGGSPSNTDDDNGHGTHVAGIAAAVSDNSKGTSGLSWNNKIMPVKVLDRYGEGDLFGIISGISYATDQGAKVLNLSLGSPTGYSAILQDAVNYAHSKGVVVVAAAGNTPGEVEYPAALSNVIAVGATDAADKLADFSSTGNYIDLVAPGTNILSTTPNHHVTLNDADISGTAIRPNYDFMDGTSMSAPHVAALASLVLGRNRTLGPDQVEAALEATSYDLGSAGRDDAFGWGRLDPVAAVSSVPAEASTAADPPIRLTEPQAMAVSDTVTVSAEVDGPTAAAVSFYIDGVLAGEAAAPPYAIAVDSISRSNSWHKLEAVTRVNTDREVRASRFVYFDNRPPSITFAYPPEGFSVGGTVEVEGASDDDSGRADLTAYVSHDSGRTWKSLPPSAGPDAWPSEDNGLGAGAFVLEATGNHPIFIKMTATDPVGHTTSVIHGGRIDNTPPPIRLTSRSVQYVRLPKTVVSGKAEPGATVSVSWSGANRGQAAAAVDGAGKFSRLIRLQREGKTAIYVMATDEAGNTAAKKATVFFDYHGPTLTWSRATPARLVLPRRALLRFAARDNVFSNLTASVYVYRVRRYWRRDAGGGSSLVSERRLVRTLRPIRRTRTFYARWDGRDSSGAFVSAGRYYYRIRVRDMCGNARTSSDRGPIVVVRRALINTPPPARPRPRTPPVKHWPP